MADRVGVQTHEAATLVGRCAAEGGCGCASSNLPPVDRVGFAGNRGKSGQRGVRATAIGRPYRGGRSGWTLATNSSVCTEVVSADRWRWVGVLALVNEVVEAMCAQAATLLVRQCQTTGSPRNGHTRLVEQTLEPPHTA